MEEDELTRLLMVGDVPKHNAPRWLALMIVIGVVGGFSGLAWYAYRAGTHSLKDEDLLVVEADKNPVKEKPADPGGMQFPNQDKTIFETFSGAASQQPRVERVVPPPEEPVSSKGDTETTGWVNDKIHKDNTTQKPTTVLEQVIGKDEKKPAETAEVIKPQVIKVKKEAVDETETYVAGKPPKTEEPSKPAIVKVPPPKADVPKPAANGTAKVQLGAYRSEAEAKDAWGKMQQKHSELSGREPIIVKADLGARGIYYRLRLGGFSASEAKSFCHELSAAGQACLLPTD